MERQNQTLTLVDNNSVNYTFINGERVHPHERRVVRDGDELRLGKLTLRVSFQRELRRIG
ncbi:MAG: FHA domain-containing protein [Anaerolineae bacterium]|nr:FHA domain-containing protein [Anaerolineae bacterium]